MATEQSGPPPASGRTHGAVASVVGCVGHAARDVGIYPDRKGVRVKADGPGAVNCAQQSGEGWSRHGWQLPQMVRDN
jgi:hypothetical protein